MAGKTLITIAAVFAWTGLAGAATGSQESCPDVAVRRELSPVPQALEFPALGNSLDQEVALGEDGSVDAVFSVVRSGSREAMVSYRHYDAKSGSWGEERRLSGEGITAAVEPCLIRGQDGRLYAVWLEIRNDRDFVVFATSTDRFESARRSDFPLGKANDGPRLLQDGRGDLWLYCRSYLPQTKTAQVVGFHSSDNGQTWQNFTTGGTVEARDPRMWETPKGRRYLAWIGVPDEAYSIMTAKVDGQASGQLSSVKTVARAGAAVASMTMVQQGERVGLVWLETQLRHVTVKMLESDDGGEKWSSPRTIVEEAANSLRYHVVKGENGWYLLYVQSIGPSHLRRDSIHLKQLWSANGTLAPDQTLASGMGFVEGIAGCALGSRVLVGALTVDEDGSHLFLLRGKPGDEFCRNQLRTGDSKEEKGLIHLVTGGGSPVILYRESRLARLQPALRLLNGVMKLVEVQYSGDNPPGE